MLYGYDSYDIIPCCQTTDNKDDKQAKRATALYSLKMFLIFLSFADAGTTPNPKRNQACP